MVLPEEEVRACLDFATALVAETRTILSEFSDSGFEKRVKADRSIVTAADQAVETHVRSAVSQRFPDHGIIGEEQRDHLPGADFTWTIDPIDGTLSFVHGVPLYSTFLALLHRGEPVVGIIDLPGLNRCYCGGKGLGVRCNGRTVTLGGNGDDVGVEHEILALGERRQFLDIGKSTLFDRAMRCHRHVRTYCDGFGHAMALEGSVGAMIDVGLKIWDVAPIQLLIREAGGSYVRFGTGTTPAGRERFDILFGKPAVVTWLQEELELGELT